MSPISSSTIRPSSTSRSPSSSAAASTAAAARAPPSRAPAPDAPRPHRLPHSYARIRMFVNIKIRTLIVGVLGLLMAGVLAIGALGLYGNVRTREAFHEVAL